MIDPIYSALGVSSHESESVDRSDQESSENIRILVRIRPPLYPSEPMALEAQGPQTLRAISSDGRKTVTCSYDYVLSPDSSQGEVYKIVQQCTDAVLAGYNSTVFAYGQTGSGKTHTMFGPPGSISEIRTSDQIGIIPRAINDIFHLAKSPDVNQFSVLCSFVQLYNEQCYDMLRDGSMSTALQIREDVTGEIYVQGLSEYIVKSIGDTLLLLKTAEDNRAIRETNMNQYSSRSHSIFQILVEQKKTASDGGEITLKAKFNLVDLAGSEKWNTRQDMMQEHISEMTNINLSLHTLGKCISALVKRSKPGSANMHVPYRDSKLTRLLQDSLGGNSKTFLIATVSPAASNADESINTLKFADRAKQVMVQAKVNESRPIDHAMVQSLQNEVKNLKHLLKEVSMFIQVVIGRAPSPSKQSSGVLSRFSHQSEEDTDLAEGGAFLTNHASVNCRSVRVAFGEVDSDENRSADNQQNSQSSKNRADKKAALFEAIQAALSGGVIDLSRKSMEYNIASYSAPPAASVKTVSSTDATTIRSDNVNAEIARLSEMVQIQSEQLKSLEQREMHTWNLLEAVQGTMKMFFNYEIEEDDMKKQVNKLFGNLMDVKEKKSMYFSRDKTNSIKNSVKLSCQTSENMSLPVIASKNNPNSKIIDAALKVEQNRIITQPKEETAAAVMKPLVQERKKKPSRKGNESTDSDSGKDDGEGGAPKKSLKTVSNLVPQNGPVSFRVRGAQSSQADDGQNWQAFGGPIYTEEEQEAILLEKIKQKKKKKRKEEKVAEWLRSKEERSMEVVNRESQEKAAREEEERIREEKRRIRAQKQKLKLNDYYARVKSDLVNIQQMNEMGLSPDDVI